MPRNHSFIGFSQTGQLMIRWLALASMSLAATTVSAQMVAQTDAVQPSSRSEVLDQQRPGQLDTIRRNALPFGHSLFSGGFGSDESNGVNADYIVDVGDRVSVSYTHLTLPTTPYV